MPAKLFISYTREKNEFNAVTILKKRLENELRRKTGDSSLNVFQDVDIITGTDWNQKPLDELDAANCLVILLSPLWLTKPYCQKEFHHYRSSLTAKTSNWPIVTLEWDATTLEDAQRLNSVSVYTEVKKYQISDWTETQYLNWTESKPQLALAKLASEIKLLLRL